MIFSFFVITTIVLLSGIDVLPQLNVKSVSSVWQWTGNNSEQALRFASQSIRAADLQSDPRSHVLLPYSSPRHEVVNTNVLAYSFVLPPDPSYRCAHEMKLEKMMQHCVSIFFPQLHNDAIVFLNGKRIVTVAVMTFETRYRWLNPVTVALPQEAMHRDGSPDVITIVESTTKPMTVIQTPFYGKPDEVALVHSAIYFFGITLSNANNVFCLMFGVFILRIWFASRTETVFLYSGCTACFWALLFIFTNWAAFPSPLHSLWRSLVYLCEAGLSLSTTMYVLSFINTRLPRYLFICLVSFACVAPLMMFSVGAKSEPYLDLYWSIPYFVLYLGAFYKLLQYSLRLTDRASILLIIVSLFTMTLVVHDYAISFGAFFNAPYLFEKWSWSVLFFEPIFLSQVVLPLMLFLKLSVLQRKYQEKLALIQTSNQRLELALNRREAELEVGYQQRNRLLKDESARMERERIYQDVHDGLGSVLVAAIYRVKSGEFDRESIMSLLKDAIDNMRRIVNGVADEAESVQSMLFDYCMQVESFLQVSKIQIHYDISTGPEICLLRHVQTNLFRCVQEAVSNVLKHANCNNLYISLNQTDSYLQVIIRDDGCGFVLKEKLESTIPSQSDPQLRAGLGLPGIRNRVRRIGGQLKFDSVPNFGTMITIDLPLS